MLDEYLFDIGTSKTARRVQRWYFIGRQVKHTGHFVVWEREYEYELITKLEWVDAFKIEDQNEFNFAI